MAGFSFTDEKEAGGFYKKVEAREKYAKSKAPRATPTARSSSGSNPVTKASAVSHIPTSRPVGISISINL